jgi:hypothetical protein
VAEAWTARSLAGPPDRRQAGLCVDDEVARDALVTALVKDALAIIDALPVTGLDEDQERRWRCWRWWPVRMLSRVRSPERGGSPRAVAKDRIVSTVDPESRHAHKSTSSYRDGFKGHIAAEPETGLITSNTLTGANTGDGQVAVGSAVKCLS